MEYRPLRYKTQFVKDYKLGLLGNASPTWDTLTEFQVANPRAGKYHIRNRVAGGPTYYDIPVWDVHLAWDVLTREQGVDPKSLYISAMAPTELTLIQGEVWSWYNGINLLYSQVRKPMRDALKEQNNTVSGLRATSLLRQYLCPNSYEWLHVLLERYPDHVVEFSTYDKCWGTLPNYNTVFWECRAY